MATCFVKSVLSIVAICEKLTTDVLSRPETDFSSYKLPGRYARSVLELITAQITVLILLRLKLSP